MTKVTAIQKALDTEAAKLGKRYSGRHVFNAPQPGTENGANWTATFYCVASTCPLDDRREALERVQAKFPVVEFTQK